MKKAILVISVLVVLIAASVFTAVYLGSVTQYRAYGSEKTAVGENYVKLTAWGTHSSLIDGKRMTGAFDTLTRPNGDTYYHLYDDNGEIFAVAKVVGSELLIDRIHYAKDIGK